MARNKKRKKMVSSDSCQNSLQASKGAGDEGDLPKRSDEKAKTHEGPRKRRNTGGQRKNLVLWWHSIEPHVPLEVEEDMMNVILRWGKNERGMLRDQPEFRLKEIQTRCNRNRFALSQACSLRRHHMQQLNPALRKDQLQLGKYSDIRAAAELFEQTISTFLNKHNIDYYDEASQKAHFKRNNPGQPLKGTPDFKMKGPVLLKVYSKPPRVRNRNRSTRIHAERTIHWLEAKMFYGASTIPSDGKSAVGSIVPKMKKYVDMYGEGAIVFSQGCGDKLARELEEIGVTALSCSSREFDLSKLERHQKTWCSDRNGNILP